MKKLIVPLVLTLVLFFSFLFYNNFTGQSVAEQNSKVELEKRIVTKV